MEDFSILYTFFEKLNQKDLSEAEKEKLNNCFREETFQKKEIIFNAGDANTRHYYIKKGLLRLYIIDQSGKEFNILFAREKQWIGDLGTPSPTPYYLEAVENSCVFSIEEEKFKIITQNFSNFAGYIRKSYIFLQKRFVSVLSQTAEENYQDLLENSPDLIQRLPQYHISSYLGVTPVFLSKIISKTFKKKKN